MNMQYIYKTVLNDKRLVLIQVLKSNIKYKYQILEILYIYGIMVTLYM